MDETLHQNEHRPAQKKATNDFENGLCKLINDFSFRHGHKTVLKWAYVKLVCSHEEDKLRHIIVSPAFARQNVFDTDLGAIHMHKSRLVPNRPFNVGMNILHLSKRLMCNLYYPKMKREYGKRYQLFYTDTDSP